MGRNLTYEKIIFSKEGKDDLVFSTVNEAVEKIGCSKNTVYFTLRYGGKIFGYKVKGVKKEIYS